MHTIGEALREMLEAFETLGTEQVPLLQARDRVAARAVIARYDLPHFDNSAMDGYAIRASDVPPHDTRLPVIGEARAGGGLPPELTTRSAMRIFTGAPLPAGADTVVMQENTTREGDHVVIRVPAKCGANVRARGSDLRAGDTCIAASTLIDPGAISMLAGQGVGDVCVYRRPRVAIVATGDELRELGEPLDAGAIYNSNSYALAAAVESAGAEAWRLPIARDEVASIERTLRSAFEADVVLCCGGVSVGDYDLVGAALQQLGVQSRFHKVAMKPGKPLMFALRGATPFVGLPGNPVSSWVAFEVFVRPCLRKMLGHVAVHPRAVDVVMGHAHRRSTGRVELARARLVRGADGTEAHLVGPQGSGSLPSLVGVDALLILPAEQAELAKGESLRALVLHEARGQRLPVFE